MVRITKKIKLREPILIAAWPGMGEVAFKAAQFLKDKLRAMEFASLEARDFFSPSSASIAGGLLKMPQLPQDRFYYWRDPRGKNDLLFFLSNAQPDLTRAYDLAKEVLKVAKGLGVRQVVTFAAMPLPIDHTQSPGVWVTATERGILKKFKADSIKIMSEGQISGLNGLLLAVAKEEGLKGVCLLGEIPLFAIQIENPKASLAVLEALCRWLGISIDITELKAHAKFIEEEIDKLIHYIKGATEGGPLGPIGEEEIERIKKALSLQTKLPESARKSIEKIFEQAKRDISKANQLKAELDKWNVYKEYEDRFLDLFKKKEERG